ncbi:antibiotic transport system permease component [Klebsiella oxytoca]|nr:antibiotic transport system permease component [Klebsiella oxytoca]
MRGLRNIYNLGMKELRSLLGDKAMLTLIVFAFNRLGLLLRNRHAGFAASGAHRYCRHG